MSPKATVNARYPARDQSGRDFTDRITDPLEAADAAETAARIAAVAAEAVTRAGADTVLANAIAAHLADLANPHATTKAQVGLGLVPNTDFTTHASRHVSGGADSIKLDDFAAPDDNTDLNASTTAHGLLKKLSNVATEFMNGQGAWAVPAGAGSAVYAVAHSAVVQSHGASGAFVAVTFDTDDDDASGLHDTAVNTSRFTIITAGVYDMMAAVPFVPNATGTRAFYWQKNGATTLGTQTSYPGSAASRTITLAFARAALVAGDYVEILAFQDSGGALDMGDSGTRRIMSQAAILKVG